jgi:hypothetical protein
MALIYITGISGAGKSTVRAELVRRGYPAYDTDEGGLARWFENASGTEVSMPEDPGRRDDDWFANYTYRLPPETVRRIAAEVDEVGFVCGVVGNDNEIWDLFAAVINLSIPADLLRKRLAGRVDAFGASADELERVLGWQARVDRDNSQYGAVMIDASGPVEVVVDELLAELELPSRVGR